MPINERTPDELVRPQLPRSRPLPPATAPLARPSLGRPIGMTLYILFLFVPIYWLLNISFKTNSDILGALSLWPQHPTLDNYRRIFVDAEWHASFVNSILYVGDQYGHLGDGGVARRLRVQPLSFRR